MHPVVPMLAVVLAGWLNQQQQHAIKYLREENRVLREQLGGKRLRLHHDQRRRLAVKGKALGRRLLEQVCTVVSLNTILRWHRELIARKYDGAGNRRAGKTGVMRSIRLLCVRMATENPGWVTRGFTGALDNLGHRVGRTTIRRVLREHGLEPAPQRHLP